LDFLTVTTPTECLEAAEFQKLWHSFLTHGLKKVFPHGMWVRERQPRSQNWHAHAVVNVGWDIKTGFPFDQVKKRFYANVDPKLRDIWKQLREISDRYGFGRIELLPIKHSGPACARYLTSYLAKGFTETGTGDRTRLFGIWGGQRSVYSQFSFVSSRIIRKRKQWLADELGIKSEEEFRIVLGPHWWFHTISSRYSDF